MYEKHLPDLSKDLTYFIYPCVFLFFRESLRHLELFSGIVRELIELCRAKLTEILTRQKTLVQAPVFQLMFQRVAAATTRSPA